MQVREIVANEATQQHHQFADLRRRPRPVFRTEGKDRQNFDPKVAGGADGAAQRLNSATMALPAWQTARRRPTSVAIHDDGNMPRHGEIAFKSPQRLGLRHTLKALSRSTSDGEDFFFLRGQ